MVSQQCLFMSMVVVLHAFDMFYVLFPSFLPQVVENEKVKDVLLCLQCRQKGKCLGDMPPPAHFS